MSQLSFLSIATRNKKLRCEKFLDEMLVVVPWKRLCNIIRPYYFKEREGQQGRKPIPLERILKIHCMQQWFGLSDPGMEEAIYDRNSFQKFLRLDLLSDKVPDETTILNFRHLLESNKLSEPIFEEINKYLAEKNLLLKNGTAVDATLIAAPSSKKNKAKSRDKEMSSTKKGDNWYFGMKAHIGVQTQGKPLIHSVETTTAKDHDITQMENLLHGEETNIFADKGYFKEENKKEFRKRGIFYGVLDKASRGHKLSSKQNKRNKKLSSVRAKVEHPFQIIKCQWNYRKTRYKGLKKNTGQLNILFGLANVFMVRKQLLQLAT
ncbi:IS5 family transposase [Pseudomonadota bacterium]